MKLKMAVLITVDLLGKGKSISFIMYIIGYMEHFHIKLITSWGHALFLESPVGCSLYLLMGLLDIDKVGSVVKKYEEILSICRKCANIINFCIQNYLQNW